jgi:protoheme IX farnesyltransferase
MPVYMKLLIRGVSDMIKSMEAMVWSDYWTLGKPRVVALMLLTALIGMLMATDTIPPWQILLWGNLGIGLCAISAAAINHLADRRLDRKMQRTRLRPLADERLAPMNALVFALLTGLTGTTMLWVLVNPLTAMLSVAALMGYALFYTFFLKYRTPQNIVIGGLAGASPPVLGWTAVTAQVDPPSLLLVLIIFTWTPPHFWALALARREEYAKAKVPMLPVTHGVTYTRWHVVFYTILLLASSLLPFAVGLSGTVYLLGALVLGGIYLYWTILMLWQASDEFNMLLFRYSIWYLGLLFGIMLLDHYLLRY